MPSRTAKISTWILLAGVLALAPAAAAAAVDTAAAVVTAGTVVPQSPEPQVRAVFFYSPSCPHCHEVMEKHLPPLFQLYGEALRIVAVNVDTREGQALYQAVVRYFEVPRDRLGVPTLVVGERVLVGAWEIPFELPGIIAQGLAGEGVDWPPVPAVRSYLSLKGVAEEEPAELEGWMLAGGPEGGEPVLRMLGPAGASPPGESPWERFMRDPTANGIAVAVLVAMIAVLAVSVREVHRPRRRLPEWQPGAIPVLAVVGGAIALYLAMVEVSGAEAVCGPVGDCNRVQTSSWAYVAGVPVGVLGLAGYVLIGGLGVARRSAPGRRDVPLLLWGGAAVGVGFSAWLTFLEPFVIGATCMWCIGSAVVMTLILVAATPAAARVRSRSGSPMRGGGRRAPDRHTARRGWRIKVR